MLAPPTSTASSIGRRPPGGDDAVDELGHGDDRRTCTSPGPRARRWTGSTTCASPATPSRRSSSARPMHEPRPRDTRTSPATAEAASSPILTIVSAIELQAQPREHLVDAALRPGRAGTRRSSPRPRRRGRSRAAARRRRRRRARRARSATIAPSMSVAAAGGVGSSSSPVIVAERVDVGGADDVADLHQRGRRRSRCRPRRPAGRTSARRRWA